MSTPATGLDPDIAARLRHIPGAVDVHVHQAFDAPTLHLDIDRPRVQSVGMNARDVAQNVLVSLSSSFQTAPSFWLDPRNGVSYQVAVQTPQYRLDSVQALDNLSVGGTAATASPQLPMCMSSYGSQRPSWIIVSMILPLPIR